MTYSVNMSTAGNPLLASSPIFYQRGPEGHATVAESSRRGNGLPSQLLTQVSWGGTADALAHVDHEAVETINRLGTLA
jgi:hypothetical protein